MKKWILFFPVFCFLFFSCKKDPIIAGTTITAKGIVFDSIKNRIIPNATVYLYGGNSGFYGRTFGPNPIDSATTSINGDFSIKHIASGNFAFYTLSITGGIDYKQNLKISAVEDYRYPYYELKDNMNLNQNIVISGRELNKGTIKLTIVNNPYDTIYVRLTSPFYYVNNNYRFISRTLDTTLEVPYLINIQHSISYSISSHKLATDSFSQRRLIDTFNTSLGSSQIVSKNFSSTYQIPIYK